MFDFLIRIFSGPNKKSRRPNSGKKAGAAGGAATRPHRGQRPAPKGNAGHPAGMRGWKPSGGGSWFSQAVREAHKGQGFCRNVAVVYHGTTSVETVKSIRRDGWQIGSGNLHGDGIYFSRSLDEARSYAGSSGVVIKCRVTLGKSAVWNAELEKRYQKWCRDKNISADASAKTAFLLKHGYKTLQAGSILVVLKPQFNNHSAWRQKVGEIRICSVHKADTHRRIPV